MNWSSRYLMNQKHFTNTLVTMLIHGRKLSAIEMQPETLPHSHFWWCDNSSILNGFKMFVCFIVFVLFWFVFFLNFFFEGGGVIHRTSFTWNYENVKRFSRMTHTAIIVLKHCFIIGDVIICILRNKEMF